MSAKREMQKLLEALRDHEREVIDALARRFPHGTKVWYKGSGMKSPAPAEVMFAEWRFGAPRLELFDLRCHGRRSCALEELVD